MIIIKWNKLALHQFELAIEYIELDSPSNAKKVKRRILLKIDELQHHPEKHAPTSTRLTMMEASRHSKFIITEFHIGTKMVK